MNNLKPVEHNNQRILLTSQLVKGYETTEDNIKKNFSNHKDRFKEGKHYFLLEGDELRVFKSQVNNIHLVSKYASKLYLWTEKGALHHAKILDTDKAWEVYEELEDTYFRVRQQQIETSSLSPELQMVNNLFRAMAKVETENKQIKAEVQETKEEIKGIREVVKLDTTSWIDDSRKLIIKIAHTMGGNEYIRTVYTEAYELVNKRLGVNIGRRITNKRRRMAEEGICKSKREKVNGIDVIAEDKKLIEGFVAIVKEMAVKHGAA